MYYIKKIQAKVNINSLKNIATIFTGNSLGRFFNFIALTMLARILETEDYAVLSIAIRFMSVSTMILGMGLKTTAVRFLSPIIGNKQDLKFNKIMRVFFESRIVTIAVSTPIILYFSDGISNLIFNKSFLSPYIKLSIIGIAGLLLLEYPLVKYQASELFNKYILFNNGTNVLRFVLVVFFYLIQLKDIRILVGTWMVPPLLIAVVGVIYNKSNSVDITFAERKNIFGNLLVYGKWLYISQLSTQVWKNLDKFFLTKYWDLETVGNYFAASTLIMAVSMINTAVVTFYLPKVSRLGEKKQLKNFLKKIMKVSIAIIVILLFGLLFSKPIILLTYGEKYLGIINIFRILYLSALFPIIYTGFSLVFYAINAPKMFALQNIIQAITAIILYWMTIPLFGSLGAAYSTLVVQFVGLIFVLVIVFREIYE